MVNRLQIELPMADIERFCQKWQITEFALFGSVLREDFGPERDVDALVTFRSAAPWTLWNLIEMRDELGALLGRPVDMVEKRALRNPFRRREILATRQVVYAS